VSLRASHYAKDLTICPNGELVTPREKLVVIALGDLHQDKAGFYLYPSVKTVAASAMCDQRSCQRYLAALEKKGVIKRLRPPNQGRGMTIFYFFPELEIVPEGWQAVTLLLRQKDGRRATEGRQKGDMACKSSNRNLEQKQQEQQKQEILPLNPPQAGEVVENQPPGESSGTEGQRPREASGAQKLPVCEEAEPARSREASGTASSQSLNHATGQVCASLDITNPRRWRLVRRAIASRVDKGEPAPTVALAMIAACRRKAELAHLLRPCGLDKFIGDGIWVDERSWYWDKDALHDRQMRLSG
jgi:hypothetical protein